MAHEGAQHMTMTRRRYSSPDGDPLWMPDTLYYERAGGWLHRLVSWVHAWKARRRARG